MNRGLPRPLRVGVIGAGGVAQSSHLPAFAWLIRNGWPVSIVAIADPQPERIVQAERLLAPNETNAPCAAFTSGTALFAAGNCDAVLILTPPVETAPLLEIALAGGVPTLAEKPAAETAQTLADLVRRENDAANSLVRIAYNRRSLPLAPVFRARLREMQLRSSSLHIEARLWRARRTDAIFYRDTMVHALDFLLWSVGSLNVRHIEWSPPRTPGGLPSALRVSFASPNNERTARLDVRPAVGRDAESYEVLGDRESMKFTYPPAGATGRSKLFVYETGEPREIVCAPPDDFAANDPNGLTERGFLPQLAHFLQAVARAPSKAAPLCTLAEAHDAAALKEAVLGAARPQK